MNVTIRVHRSHRSLLLVLPVSLALMAGAAAEARASVEDCRSAAIRLAGTFAKKRTRHILACEAAGGCDLAASAAKPRRLHSRSLALLAAACRDVEPGGLGLGSTCPDTTGRCTLTLDTPGALVECMLCLVSETIEPLIRRLEGAPGDVSEPCGGCASGNCGTGSFCETPPGLCDGTRESGTCIDVPEVCPEHIDPVCGCDGKTYDNDCVRQSHRVGLFHPGACQSPCGEGGVQCADGTFCDSLPGLCDHAAQGICEPLPLGCPDNYEPVCGCDGKTYGNDCERRSAGVQLAYSDECEASCGDDDDCGSDAICLPPPGVCDAAVDGGKCFPISPICPLAAAPFPLLAVCGCDGRTYDSACEAIRNKVQVAHEGPCADDAGCSEDAQCAEGEKCVPLPHICLLVASPIAPRRCTAVPETCPPDDRKACGCDLETYASHCEANRAGAGVAYAGPCLGGVPQ